MDNSIDEILKIIKQYKSIDNEGLYKLKIKTLIIKCLNYCHLEELPPQLYNPVAENLVLSEGTVNTQGATSLKVGDTSITYGDNDIVNNAFLSLKSQLNRYRRVGTIGAKNDRPII